MLTVGFPSTYFYDCADIMIFVLHYADIIIFVLHYAKKLLRYAITITLCGVTVVHGNRQVCRPAEKKAENKTRRHHFLCVRACLCVCFVFNFARADVRVWGAGVNMN